MCGNVFSVQSENALGLLKVSTFGEVRVTLLYSPPLNNTLWISTIGARYLLCEAFLFTIMQSSFRNTL